MASQDDEGVKVRGSDRADLIGRRNEILPFREFIVLWVLPIVLL